MSETGAEAVQPERPQDLGLKLLYFLTVGMVFIGMVNAMPEIPGLDAGFRAVTGIETFSLNNFPYEIYYPLFFALMMLCVVLKHSFWRDWADRGTLTRGFGLFMDVALLVAGFGIMITYMVENEAVCLIDQFTGDRARIIAEALKEETELNKTLGLPAPTSIDDPECLNSTGGFLVLIVGLAVIVFLTYNIKVWGFPLVLVSLLISAYTIITVLVWYFHGPEDINKYLMTKLAGEPRLLSDGRPKVHDILVNTSSGLLGRFMDIILNTVFPYIVLGGLFGASAGGRSLIKLAFRWTRHLRGGPAHAAIVSSAMFGTVSGGPIVNVLSTGVLTIPMMIKRGFSKVFAGGMEAAASSGGSIMPPVMGVAAFVLVVLTGVPYSDIIIAAIIPAIAYFICLFLSAVFQSRKQNIEAIGELTDEMRMSRQDILNLIMILGPILLILLILLTSKESVGCGFFGGMFGAERVFQGDSCKVTALPWFMEIFQNAAGDAGSAGWWAVMLLTVLLFVDPEMRRRPKRFLDALAGAGQLIATLYLMFLAISVIDFCLSFTGLPAFFALDVLSWLQSLGLGDGSSVAFQLLALAATMLIAILLGMGMPAVPAYINVALLMGPVLAGLGISIFTAHMFIFYFAIASAITPPVALAAFAAASITKAEPMATGFSAVRSGFVMFLIPFIFAFYPELLLIDAALLDPNAAGGKVQYLPGYSADGIGATHFILLIGRLLLALYLIASAFAQFDRQALKDWEWIFRLILAGLLFFGSLTIWAPAAVVAIAYLIWHGLQARKQSIMI